MKQYYYTYDDLMVLLSCSKRTLMRKINSMSLQKRYFNGTGKPYFLVVDVHAFMHYNKPFAQCTHTEKQWIRELIDG
jgi:hypothetical protein